MRHLLSVLGVWMGLVCSGSCYSSDVTEWKLSCSRVHCSNNISSSEPGVSTILLIILILLLVGALPTWPHSRSWGYGPSGLLGVVLVVLLILLLLGRI
jgi:hypothetical protein